MENFLFGLYDQLKVSDKFYFRLSMTDIVFFITINAKV